MRTCSRVLLALLVMIPLFAAPAPGSAAVLYDPAELKMDAAAWSLPLASLSPGASTVWGLVDESDLFVLDSNNVVHCIDVEKGTHRWILALDEPPSFPPVIGRDVVGVCSGDRIVLAKRLNGARILDRAIEFAPSTPLAVSAEAVFAGAAYKERVVAVDPKTGATGWSFRFTEAVTAAPKLYGQGAERMLYVVVPDGLVVCLEPRPASEAAPQRPEWKHPTNGRIVAEPVADADLLLVSCLDGSLYAYNRFSGAIRWRHLTGGSLTQPPVVIGGSVYLPAGAEMMCLDRASGNHRWSASGYGKVAGEVGGHTYLWTDGGFLGIMNAETGKLVRAVEPAGATGIITSPRPDMLFFTDSRAIYAYTKTSRPQAGAPAAGEELDDEEELDEEE